MKYRLRVVEPKLIKLSIDFETEKSVKFKDMIVITCPDEKLNTNFIRSIMESFKLKYPNKSLLLLPKGVEIFEIEEIF
jgi:hypothetical protein